MTSATREEHGVALRQPLVLLRKRCAVQHFFGPWRSSLVRARSEIAMEPPSDDRWSRASLLERRGKAIP